MPSFGGEKIILVVKDDFSLYTWLYFLKSKKEISNVFKMFVLVAYHPEVEIVRSDNGGEWLGEFRNICRDSRINLEFTTESSPQINGVAERALSTLSRVLDWRREFRPSKNYRTWSCCHQSHWGPRA